VFGDCEESEGAFHCNCYGQYLGNYCEIRSLLSFDSSLPPFLIFLIFLIFTFIFFFQLFFVLLFVLDENACPEVFNYARARWPATNPGDWANGFCTSGYSGRPLRKCTEAGTWDSLVHFHCESSGSFLFLFRPFKLFCFAKKIKKKILPVKLLGNTCPSIQEGNAKFNKVFAFQVSYGTCLLGFTGSVRRVCEESGTWGPIIGSCTPSPNCPEQRDYVRADWPETIAGDLATGTCNWGWRGSPTRQCLSEGSWSSSVSDHCLSFSLLSLTLVFFKLFFNDSFVLPFSFLFISFLRCLLVQEMFVRPKLREMLYGRRVKV